jgi:hypothetical protein
MMQETKPTKTVNQTRELTHSVSYDRALQDDELNVVTGGIGSVNSVIKSIGQALQTVASKQ